MLLTIAEHHCLWVPSVTQVKDESFHGGVRDFLQPIKGIFLSVSHSTPWNKYHSTQEKHNNLTFWEEFKEITYFMWFSLNISLRYV